MQDHNVSMILLLDYYGELLTEKQRTYFDLCYNQDFSLAEIAEEEGVSRQAVYDVLTRTEAILRNFEEKTGFVEKAIERNRTVQRIRLAAKEVGNLPGGEDIAQQILTLCNKIGD